MLFSRPLLDIESDDELAHSFGHWTAFSRMENMMLILGGNYAVRLIMKYYYSSGVDCSI